VIAGWARLSVLLTQRGVTNDYLERATRLWKHASKGGTQTASPHLLLSSLEMHRVTQQSPYFDLRRAALRAYCHSKQRTVFTMARSAIMVS